MKNILMACTTFSTILLAACSSTPISNTTAIQRPNSQFEVTGLGKSNIIAKNNAVNAANKTCGKASAIIIDEKTAYNGVLNGVVDQQTGQIIQAATNVLGKIAGTNTDIAKDDDYQTTLTFQCKANN